MHHRCWVLLLLLSLYGTLVSADSASLPAIKLDRSYEHLAGLVEVYDDLSTKLELNDVLDLPASSWEKVDVAAVNRGPIDAVIWIHFRIDATTNDIDINNWQLSVNNALLVEVELFVQMGKLGWLPVTPGGDHPTDFYTSPNKSHVFNIPIKPGVVNDYYLRVFPHSAALIPMNIMPKEELRLWLEQRNIITFSYYGAMVFMFLFFLLLSIGAKSKIYGLHALYIASVMLFNMTVDGFFQEYVLVGKYSPQIFISLFAYITLFAGVQFTIAVLRSKERIPKLHMALSIASYFSILSIIVIPFLGPTENTVITVALTMLTSPLILMACATVYMQGHKEVRYFTLGWFAFLFFTLTGAVTFEGLLPWTPITPFYVHLGSILETALITFSLADQFNHYRMKKIESERQARDQLKAINDQLLKSNQLKDQFLSTISHELRTPMNGVVGALDLIKQEQITPIIRDYLITANRSANNMVRLIDDLLCFSDLLSNEKSLNSTDFALEQMKRTLSNSFAAKAAENSIEFEIDVDRKCEQWLRGDIEKINTILFQLTDNAIKFTHQGSVSISIETLKQTNNQANLVVAIKDTGIGMDKDKVKNLYEAFHQVDAAFNRKYGGLGIGLAICKKVVENLNGDIDIHSTLGEGTLVEITIPLHITEAPCEHAPASEAAEKINPVSQAMALIVEDNLINQKVLAGFLKKLGVTTQIANNGEEGVKLCEQMDFDIIFMDCQMPVMDGFESTQRIRMPGARNCNTPIVAVTANALEKDKENCAAVGMNDFLKKPVKLNNIKDSLEKYFIRNSNNSQKINAKG